MMKQIMDMQAIEQRGIEKGIMMRQIMDMQAIEQKGIEKGIQKGYEEGLMQIVFRLFKKGMNLKEINKLTDIDIKKIEQYQKIYNQNKTQNNLI